MQICYSLGFNLEVARIQETDEQKRRRIRLFWFIVMSDKCLSLRLGRPSNIRNCDLAVSRLTEARGVAEPSIMPSLLKWVDWALLQGNIYDDLFSPGAMLQPESIRVARARTLATELQTVYGSTSPPEVS